MVCTQCLLTIFFCSFAAFQALPIDELQHPVPQPADGEAGRRDWISPPGEGPETDWSALAKQQLGASLEWTSRISDLSKQADNVVFMMGDGLGISTTSAARVYMAQSRGIPGDAAALSWEELPYTAMIKTYSTDATTADSASTATAMLCGEKCNFGVVCSNQQVLYSNCTSWVGNRLQSVLRDAVEAGKWAGIVTTTTVTHASPACAYASTPDRSWEANVPEEEAVMGCVDIATQLIHDPVNANIRVILGGGRGKFLPISEFDPEYPNIRGQRTDGRDLVQAWMQDKEDKGLSPDMYSYVMNTSSFEAVDSENTEYLLGLFEPSHMNYEIDRRSPDLAGWPEPSLAEMVDKALRILQRSPNGFFLFVEGGRIDHAHHLGVAQRALNETVALSDAVQVVKDMTSYNDTLVILTADHSHTLTIAGYPVRNAPIFEFDTSSHMVVPMEGTDDKPYATLSYANGVGFYRHRTEDGIRGPEMPRQNLTGLQEEMNDPDYRQDAGVPIASETHAGEDVTAHAQGPMAHLVIGSQQQNYLGHVMKYALCVGEYNVTCPVSGNTK